MKNILPVAIILTTQIIFACRNPQQPTLEEALDHAGSNRIELQKVLQHYSASADSLKLKAARFLIANMPYHYGYYDGDMDKYGVIFSLIDSLSYRKDNVTKEDKMHIGDSLISIYGAPGVEGIKRIPDARIVSAAFVINNIDYAFKAWQEAPWKKNVSFDDFCDFILPYRVRNEQVQYWRPACYYEYTKMARSYKYPDSLLFVYNAMNWDLVTEGTFTMYFNAYYPYPKSFDNAVKGKIGGCETTTYFSATAMQAAGLPIASDFIPQWGNNNTGHFMLRLMDHSKNRKLISNENKPVNTWATVEWSSTYDERRHLFTADELPKGMSIQYVATIPKVYRYTFSRDDELAAINSTMPAKEISPQFRYANFKDVTREYIRCTDYTLQLGRAQQQFRLVYLCTFAVSGWQPVAIARTSYGSARFRDIGRNILYLPAVYDRDVFAPAGLPFYIDSNDIVHTVGNTSSPKEQVHLIRKTALYPYTAAHSEVVKGGVFEASNDSNFRQKVILDSIDRYPFYMNEVTASQPGRYRYLRYRAPHTDVQEADNIAEVQFYGDSQRLTGRFIGSDGSDGHEISKAFDHNMDSYYENKGGKNGWIGIDLGERRKARVTKIRFCPRNDTNCIIAGEEYELFYWDGDWVSLGTQKAAADYLDYSSVPKCSVLWLKCLSSGHEERIFTYEQGVQRWW